MTQEISKDKVSFEHCGPTIVYDKIYRCFSNTNVALYRLVNVAKKQWAFYNDTTDTIVKVRAVFQPGSSIKTLRRTRQTSTLSDDGTTDNSYEQIATLEVEPFRTELFIEGTVTGFSIDFQTEAAPDYSVSFEYRRPSVPYDKIYRCFKNNGNGLLFRLVDSSKSIWAFYNDTKTYVMTVTVDFSNRDEIKPLDTTQVVTDATSKHEGGAIYKLVIKPGDTERMLEGNPVDYTLSYCATPKKNTLPSPPEEVHYENGKPDAELVSPGSSVYKCFKDNGNGLLFRLVDEDNKLWAFYNDTKDYVMTATIAIKPGETFEPTSDAEVTTDRYDVSNVVMRIPPLATRVMLHGLPNNYVASFSAESAVKILPDENPVFLNGAPDREVIDYAHVFKCFRDKENGLLFRLVTEDKRRWAFYNDTTNIHFVVQASFSNNTEVQVEDNTVMVYDENLKSSMLELEVPPLMTRLFASGDLDGYSIRFKSKTKLSDARVCVVK